jgi:syntaxin 1B/2/3
MSHFENHNVFTNPFDPEAAYVPYGGSNGSIPPRGYGSGYGGSSSAAPPYESGAGSSFAFREHSVISPLSGKMAYDWTENVDLEGGHSSGNPYANTNPYKSSIPNAHDGVDKILNETLDIDHAVTDLEARHNVYKSLTSRILSDRAPLAELEMASTSIMGQYRSLIDRMRRIKSTPEAGSPRNAMQVGRVDRKLKGSMQEFQRIEKDFRSQMREQQSRQYRIVNPDATEQEISQSVDANTQVFQQALINADRRGQAQSALLAVRRRHEAIQNIERTMLELAELFRDLDTLVQEQHVQIQDVEQKSEDVKENIEKGNVELTQVVKKAKKARKGKWICLCIGITVFIIILLIVLAIVLYVKQVAQTAQNSSKRMIVG